MKQEDFDEIVYGSLCPLTDPASGVQNLAIEMSCSLLAKDTTDEYRLIKERDVKIGKFSLHRIENIYYRYQEKQEQERLKTRLQLDSESPRRRQLSFEKIEVQNNSMNVSLNTSKLSKGRPRYVLYGTRAARLAKELANKSQSQEHQLYFNKSKGTLNELHSILEPAMKKDWSIIAPFKKVQNTSVSLAGPLFDHAIEEIKDSKLTTDRVNTHLIPTTVPTPLADPTPPGANQPHEIIYQKSEFFGSSDRLIQLPRSIGGDFGSTNSVSKERFSKINQTSKSLNKTKELRGQLAKMFIGTNAAILKFKKEDEERKRQEELKQSSGALLGITVLDRLSMNERKQLIQSNDTSLRFTNSESLRGMPAKFYLEKGNFKDMMKDTLNLMVKKNCSEIQFESMSKASENIGRLGEITNYDQRNIRFVRKYLKNRGKGTDVKKAYDIFNNEKYLLKLDECYKQKVADKEMKVQMKKLAEERAAMELLAGKREEETESLSPMKKMQAAIYENKYVKKYESATKPE